MIQTVVMVIVLLIVAAIVQHNGATVHTATPLVLPGATSVPVTLMRLLAAVGAAAVVVWLAGLLDLVLLRAALRRREAAHRATEHELARIKATVYDAQQPLLADLRARLEEIVQEMAATLARVDGVMRREGAPVAAVPAPDPPPSADTRATVREDVVETPAGPVTRRETVERTDGADQRTKRWPF